MRNLTRILVTVYTVYIQKYPFPSPTLVVFPLSATLSLSFSPVRNLFFTDSLVRRSFVLQGFRLFFFFCPVPCRRKSFNFFFPCPYSPIFPCILFLYILLLYTDSYIFYLPADHGKFGSIFP